MTGKNDLQEYKTVFQTCNIIIFLSPFLVSKKYLFKVKTGIILVSLRYQSSLGYLYRTLSLPNGPNVFIFKGCCFSTLKMKKFHQFFLILIHTHHLRSSSDFPVVLSFSVVEMVSPVQQLHHNWLQLRLLWEHPLAPHLQNLLYSLGLLQLLPQQLPVLGPQLLPLGQPQVSPLLSSVKFI